MSRISGHWMLGAVYVAAFIGGLHGSMAKAADDGSLDDRQFCHFAGGTYTDLGAGKWRCCLSNWGCYECDGSGCVFACKTRVCCIANDVSSDDNCIVFLQAGAETADTGNPPEKDNDAVLGGLPGGGVFEEFPEAVASDSPTRSLLQPQLDLMFEVMEEEGDEDAEADDAQDEHDELDEEDEDIHGDDQLDPGDDEDVDGDAEEVDGDAEVTADEVDFEGHDDEESDADTSFEDSDEAEEQLEPEDETEAFGDDEAANSEFSDDETDQLNAVQMCGTGSGFPLLLGMMSLGFAGRRVVGLRVPRKHTRDTTGSAGGLRLPGTRDA